MMSEYPATPEEALTVPGGAFFPEVKEEIHLTDYMPGGYVLRYISLDYGLDALAALWYAVDTRGRVTIYRELYVSGLIVSAAAQAIIRASNGEHIEAIYAPPDLWNRNRDTGRSSAEIFADAGLLLVKTSNDREQGWLDVKEWIKPIEEMNEQTGAMTMTSRMLILRGAAPELMRCLKAIQKDKKNPNDTANDPHELTHLPDSLRAFCAGRPVSPDDPDERDPDIHASYDDQISNFMNWGT